MFITVSVVNMILGKKFILASNSASRYKILKNAGLNFIKTKPLCEEEGIKSKLLKSGLNKRNLPRYLAKEKALSISKKKPKEIVVGSDTVIIFQNQIINKAKNLKGAKKKLQKLSGKKHQIISGVSVYYNRKEIWFHQQRSTVKFKKLSNKEIDEYIKKTGKQILLSVGCYQAEKLGPQIIEFIKGDFFNVLGFPLFPFLYFLSKDLK
ncbi:Maf family protein [Pelagibacteraceae bacterium]|nr:Maf family protein [Pelagibacteraceae bacterium]